ncbi:aryl hydrocarbon receptor repressor [Talpa occidentalis]|uniref:aryl hydrocarbon receptor repressor n=1 Tax=Talpa occidentalis TaxID=50954 RepID=UPI00188F11FA|nr:aryl hydrocarbon receptor repressor [Talpa occidentalis]
MIPPGECTYAGRKRRKPVQKRRPAVGAEKSNPSKRHRDRLNAELDHLASLLPFPPDVISKLDKLSVLRLSVSYFRVRSFFQAMQAPSPQPEAGAPTPGDRCPHGGLPVPEGRLLLESLSGFALVVSADGMIFYASATILDHLGFHQTDVLHQSVFDYIHVDDRPDFRRQLHWAMDPPRVARGRLLPAGPGEDAVLGRLLRAQQEGAGGPPELSAFLTRCFVCRVRCLLDSTSGFLTMQFQGKLKFLFGQQQKAPSGTALPPRLSLFCVVAPVLLPSVAEVKMKSTFLRAKPRLDTAGGMAAKARAVGLCASEVPIRSSCFAGRGDEGNVPVFWPQAEAGPWARVPARGPCPCLRAGPELVLDPDVASGDQGGEETRTAPGSSWGPRGRREPQAYSCPFETPGPTKHPHLTGGRQGRGGAQQKLEQGRTAPFPVHAVARGSCTPYPGIRRAAPPSCLAAFPDPHGSHPLSRPPGACAGHVGRVGPGGGQGQGQPHPGCPFPQGALQNGLPEPRGQYLPAGGYPSEASELRGVLLAPRAPCSPLLPLPIKMESDSGSEDTADCYPVAPSRLWLGASDVAKRPPGSLPARLPLKMEPECQLPICAPHLGQGMMGGPPGRSREPLQGLCVQAHQPRTPGCSYRAPGAAPVVKLEPLDAQGWAARCQGAVPGAFPKSALGTLVPPPASRGTFLP